MMAVPIYISPNGLGIPVVISTNGYGLPVVIVSGELPDPVAPEITTAASISGSTDPDGLLTLTPGASSGSPPPSRVIAWLHQGSVLDGETGLTLDKDGRIGAFQARVTWTNSAGNAVSTSNTITTEAIPTPTLTATLFPNPPVEAELLTITFSAAPDTTTATLDGSPVTLTGTGTTRTITPATDGTLVITFAKAGYTASPITVEVLAAGSEPSLSVEDVDGTPVVSGSGDVTWTITSPTEYAGTHATDQSAEYSGPLNIGYTEITAPQCIVAPVIRRHAGPGTVDNHYPGTEYRRTVGLWQVDDAAVFAQSGEWFEDGAATGYTGLGYTRTGGVGDVEYRETCAVTGLAARTAVSNAFNGEEVPGTETVFVAPDDTQFNMWSDPTGRIFIGGSSLRIFNNRVRGKSGAAFVPAFIPASDAVGNNHRSMTRVIMPDPMISTLPNGFVFPAVRCSIGTSSATRYGYGLDAGDSGTVLLRRTDSGSTSTVLLTTPNGFTTQFAGTDYPWELEIDADGYLRTYVDGVLIPELSPATPDNTIASGQPGMCYRSSWPAVDDLVNYGTYAFDCWSI